MQFLRSFACCLYLCSWEGQGGVTSSSSRPGSRLPSLDSPQLALAAMGHPARSWRVPGGAHTCSRVHSQRVQSFTPVSLLSFSTFIFFKHKTLEKILKREADVLSKNNCSLADAQELCSCISGRCLQTANCSGSLSAFAACKWHYYSLIALAHHVVFWLVSSYSASQRQGKRNICLGSSQLLTCKKTILEGFLRAIPTISWGAISRKRVSNGRGVPPTSHGAAAVSQAGFWRGARRGCSRCHSSPKTAAATGSWSRRCKDFMGVERDKT